MINKYSTILLSVVIFSSLFATCVFADGMVYYPKPGYPHWQLQAEDQQLAAINYEDGFENLMITVDVSDFQGLEGVWLFPVPSDPDDTVIDIVDSFPRFYGYDVEQKMASSISDTFDVMRLSQIYTLPFYMMSGYRTFGASGRVLESAQKTTAADYGVTVHEHIEEMGLTTELITARRAEGFYNYLTDKGLELPDDAIDILDEYIGEDYTFVVSWISDSSQYKTEVGVGYGYMGAVSTLGIHVTFPTDKIYFPLKPTSVYGSEEIPIKLYVVGHVTPELYTKVEKSTKVNYYYQSNYYVPAEQKAFFNNEDRVENLEYTVIDLKVPSKYLIDDMWVDDSAPFNIKMANFINNQKYIWGILVFVILSCLASLASGILTFRDSVPDKRGFALFGLANLLSIIGFAIGAYLMKIDEKYSKYRYKVKEQKPVGDIIKLSAIISAVIGLLIAFATIRYGGLGQILLMLLIIFSPLFLFLTAITWAYYHNKRLVQYIVSFSVLFLIMTYVLEMIMLFIF